MNITKEQVIEYLDGLSAYELVQLMGDVRERTGIELSIMQYGQQPPPPPPEPEVEKTDWDVVLKGYGDKKMAVIKEVRTQTQLGLKEAKELVEKLGVIVEAIGKEEAEAVAKAIREAGGEVELR